MENYKVKYYLNKDKTIAKFSFASNLIIDKSIVYNSIDDASNSKLVQKMFYLPFVKSVKLVSIPKSPLATITPQAALHISSILSKPS